MLFIRSLLFTLFLPIWTMLIATLGLPLMFVSNRMATLVGKCWAGGVLMGLKLLCNITYELRGLQHLPKDANCLIAAKHQSAWDTVIFLYYLKKPVYIMKKELEKIPFYGWYLPRMGMIAVDRKGGATALKDMVRQSKEKLEKHHTVVIFPEGTRTAVGAMPQYQPGIAAMYSQCNAPVVPVALNSGLFWGKGAFIKQPGKIIMQALPAIAPGLKRAEFMEILENSIEQATARLIKAAPPSVIPAKAGIQA